MRKRFFATAAFVLSVFLFVAILVYQPLLLPIAFGAVLTQGFMGPGSGKVGPGVMASWKGINYVRGYVIPADPQTRDQLTQRTKFGVAIDLARQILGNIIQPYWDQYQVKRSGFNAVVKEFLETLDGTNKLVIATKLSKGTLEGIGTLTCLYTTGDGNFETTFTNSAPSGNGLLTDSIKTIAYDKSTGIFYVAALNGNRSDGFDSMTIPTGLTATNLIGYSFAIQGTGSEQLVSDSSSDVCAAA